MSKASVAAGSSSSAQPLEVGSRRAFARDSSIILGGTWLSFVIGAAGGVLLSRGLQPEGKGNYTALFTIGLVLGAVSTLGTDVWVSRHAAAFGLTPKLRQIVLRHGLILANLGLLAAFLAIVSSVLQDGVRPRLLLLVIANIVTHGWFAMALAVYRGRRMVTQMMLMQVCNALGYLIGVVALLASDRLSVAAALAIPCITRLAAVSTPMTLRTLAEGPAQFSEWFSIVRTHLPISLGLLAEFTTYRLDIFAVGFFLGPVHLGVYSVALPLSELMWLAPNAITQILFAHVVASKSLSATATVARLTVVLALASVAALITLGPPAISLAYGAAFADAGSTLPMLGCAALVMSVWKVVTADLLARGDTTARTRGSLVALTLLALTLVPLTTAVGIVGAATATAIAYCGACVHGIRAWARLDGAEPRLLVPFRAGDWRLIRSTLSRKGAPV